MGVFDKIFPKKAELTRLERENLALKRLQFDVSDDQARTALMKRQAEAARTNRITSGWTRNSYHANAETLQDLATLRARARDLEVNDGLAKRYINLSQKNVVGPFGFTLNVRAYQVDGKGKMVVNEKGKPIVDVVASNKIKTAFNHWSNKKYCDVSQQNSFRQMQLLIEAHLSREGEALARKNYDQSNPYQFAIQLLEPDLLDETFNGKLANGNVVVMGIELNARGRRVAYHLRKVNQDHRMYFQYTGERERVDASQIYFMYDTTRALANRAISPMTPSMLRMKLLWEYERAAATNAVGSARQFGVIETSGEADNTTFTGSDVKKDATERPVIELEELSMMLLKEGEKLNRPDPKYPVGEHTSYTNQESMFIAAGLNITHAAMTGNLSLANYSNARTGKLDENETWMMRQEDLIESFLNDVYSDWLEMALLNNMIDLGSGAFAQFERFNQPYWFGRRWLWVDPESDANARLMELKSGMTSLQRVCAERGDDWEEILDEMKEVQLKAAQVGVTLDYDSVLASKPNNAGKQTSEDATAAKKSEASRLLLRAKQILNSMNGELEEVANG